MDSRTTLQLRAVKVQAFSASTPALLADSVNAFVAASGRSSRTYLSLSFLQNAEVSVNTDVGVAVTNNVSVEFGTPSSTTATAPTNTNAAQATATFVAFLVYTE